LGTILSESSGTLASQCGAGQIPLSPLQCPLYRDFRFPVRRCHVDHGHLFNDMSDGPVTVGSFDKVNIWMTVLSTIATMLLWLATMVCSSWNPLFWFHEKRDEFRQQVRLIDKVWVGSRIGMGFLLGFVRGILFLALFGVILVYISFVLQAALLLTTVEHVPDDVRKRVQLVSLGPTGIFVIAVASAWTVAAFFSCKIRRQQREPPLLVEPTQQDDDDVVAVAVATPVPSYPLTDAPCNTVTPTMMVHGQQDDDDDMQQPQQHLGDTQQPRPPVPANVMQPSFPSQDIEEPTMLSPSRRSFAIQDTEEPSTTLRISSVGEEAGRLTNHSMTPVDHSAKEEPTLHSAAPRCPVDAEEPTMIQQTSTRSLPARMDPTTAQILSTRSMPSLVLRTILRPVTTARDFARSLHSEDNDGEDAEFA